MGLKNTIISDLTEAMKAKDANRVSVLRMVKASLMNKEIEKRADLTEEEAMKMLQSMVKQRKDSIEQYINAGRNDLAEKEQSELGVIEQYLPQNADAEDIAQAVTEAIAETGASSMREMGIVMKAAQAKLAGRTVDGKALSETVKSKLQ